MEVPIEQLPDVARSRVESLMRTVKKRCSIEDVVTRSSAIGNFMASIAGRIPFVTEKQVGDGQIENWVFNQLRRDEGWVADMAQSLYEEATVTREEAVRAQLCSSIGKALPDDFELSRAEEDQAWAHANESARSMAETYNDRLRKWIEDAKKEWFKAHGGSYVGLNRFNLLKLVQGKVDDYEEWKTPQVAVTEFAHEWTEQTASFWLVNKGEAEIECLMLPRSHSDPSIDTPILCSTFAGKWFPYEEAMNLAHQHVACPHHPGKSRVVGGSLPPYMAIGAVRYRTETLPGC